MRLSLSSETGSPKTYYQNEPCLVAHQPLLKELTPTFAKNRNSRKMEKPPFNTKPLRMSAVGVWELSRARLVSSNSPRPRAAGTV